MNKLSLRFIKWGAGLLVLGLLTGYAPLFHYLHDGVEVACPAAPVHGHVVLLGWIGFTIFGLVYQALPGWGTLSSKAVKLARSHFWLSVFSVLGVFVNGIFGYQFLNWLSPSFFYKPDGETLRLWLSIDGVFLTFFAVGCALFMVVIFGVRLEVKET